jgi:hypothetical protein
MVNYTVVIEAQLVKFSTYPLVIHVILIEVLQIHLVIA